MALFTAAVTARPASFIRSSASPPAPNAPRSSSPASPSGRRERSSFSRSRTGPRSTLCRIDRSGFPVKSSTRRLTHVPSSGATASTSFSPHVTAASVPFKFARLFGRRVRRLRETSSVTKETHPSPMLSGNTPASLFDPRNSSWSATHAPIASGTDAMAFSRASRTRRVFPAPSAKPAGKRRRLFPRTTTSVTFVSPLASSSGMSSKQL